MLLGMGRLALYGRDDDERRGEYVILGATTARPVAGDSSR